MTCSNVVSKRSSRNVENRMLAELHIRTAHKEKQRQILQRQIHLITAVMTPVNVTQRTSHINCCLWDRSIHSSI